MYRRRRRPLGALPEPEVEDVVVATSTAGVPTATAVAATTTTTTATTEATVAAPSEVEPWGDKAPAKVLLRSLLEDESSWVRSEWNKGENQVPKESQASRIERIRNKNPLFKQYDKTLFYNNFRRLMTTIDDEKIAVAFDKLAFDKEHEKWPINGTLPNGKPRWQDSQAQKQLRDDLKDPEKKNKKPQQLYYDENRELYCAWSLEEFRNFLYEEKKWETQGVYWQAQRNKDMRKKAVATVDAGEWGAEHEM